MRRCSSSAFSSSSSSCTRLNNLKRNCFPLLLPLSPSILFVFFISFIILSFFDQFYFALFPPFYSLYLLVAFL